MICSRCGSGAVYWRGPLTNLTHTECEHCGAINSQVVEMPDEDEEDEEIPND